MESLLLHNHNVSSLISPGPECGNQFKFNQNSGQIIFPSNYSMNYTSNTFCEWTIEVSPNFGVQAYFDDLDIEEDKKCFNDRIIFHDGKDSSAPELGRTCGQKKILVKTTSYFLTVVFLTDTTVGGSGFKVNWTLSQGLEKRKLFSLW